MQENLTTVPSRFKMRIYTALVVLILCYGAIHLASWGIGSQIARGEHSDSAAIREIIIGNDVLRIPQNMIRFKKHRRDGIAKRVDLYAVWPQLSGYTDVNKRIFNNIDQNGKLMFISFERRVMVHDMSARFEPIYKTLVKGIGATQTNGLTRYELLETSGFVDESLYVGYKADGSRFVARCLNPKSAMQTMTPCQKDSHVGNDLSMMVRFSYNILDKWQKFDPVLNNFITNTVK
jgi:hypothetical protein